MAPSARHAGDPVHLRLSPPGGLVLTLWTGDPGLAARADAAGVDRIGVDLERLGKRERQRGLGTWISPHTEADLAAVGAAVTRARVFARVDPPNEGTHDQIERVLAVGAEVLMLPMFRGAADVERFLETVAGRAQVVLLVETREAVADIERIAEVDGVDEIHLGLNDLALALGLPNRFLLLASDVAERVAAAVNGAGRRFGAGGVGRAGDDSLPIPADLLYAQYARLGARAALISRSFLGPDPAAIDLAAEVERSRRALDEWRARGPEDLEAARAELRERAILAARW